MDETSQMKKKKLTLEILFPQKELFLDSEVHLNMNIKCIKRRQRKAGKEGQRGGEKKSMPKQKTGRKLINHFCGEIMMI